MLGRSRRASGSREPWSWDEVGRRALAIYQTKSGERVRTAVLLWQGDDPRVTLPDGSTPALIAFTMDLEPGLEPESGNAVGMAGFDSLEEARKHCVQWTGAATEIPFAALGETAQIGLYASIREPSFASQD